MSNPTSVTVVGWVVIVLGCDNMNLDLPGGVHLYMSNLGYVRLS